MVAGFGLHKLEALVERRDPMLRTVSHILLAASLLLAALALLMGWFGRDLWRPLLEAASRGEDRWVSLALTADFFNTARQVVLRDVFKASILSMLLGALLFASWRTDKLSPRLVAVAIIALAAIDLWNFGSRYLPAFDPHLAYLDRDLKTALKNDKEPFRMAMAPSFLRNAGMVDGIENAGGYDALVLKRYSEFINLAQGLPIDRPNLAMSIRRTSPLLDLLNVKYYVVESTVSADHPMFDLVFQNPNYKVYRSKKVLPRSFVVHDAWVIKERDAILRAIASPEFDPTSYAIVEEPIDNLPRSRALPSNVPRVVDYSPNRVRLEAALEKPGLLVLADVHYPGWRAFVDGQEVKVYRANYVMRAVFLPEGTHRVEFRYDPLSFRIGAVTSLISFAVLAGILVWPYVQSPESKVV
jgi:hypothetical protein